MSNKFNREGFWRPAGRGGLSFLPQAVEGDPWEGQQDFLVSLKEIESVANTVHFRGISRCRLCGKVNGSITYQANGWEWPEGYRHYIEVHNVRPSLAFQEMVLGRYLD